MRQKELRIALICYGGISLAVYMHGVTKEVWRATRASRGFQRGDPAPDGVEEVYRRILETIATERRVGLRVLTDIVAGASAGGINGVFLAQAIASGQSLEPLTRLWLEKADVDVLLDPDARPFSRFSKFWAQPLVWMALKRPGNVVSSTVAPGTRNEVRTKLSRLIRARWFAPPFSGIGFSRLIADALAAMAQEKGAKDDWGAPLLPDGHPLDLFVTATDFNGHAETLRLNSPALVEEAEHRLSIGFRTHAVRSGCRNMAHPAELVFAARATASFPGAFPPLTLPEIDLMAEERALAWPGRDAFLARIMPGHAARGELAGIALVDGSVLVNAPFAQAIAVLRDRPAQREVDRRIVYIDPKPDRSRIDARQGKTVGFFKAIFGSLSSIPREQPIRDNLEQLAGQSRERAKLRGIVTALRPEVEETVEQLFGYTLFLDRPTAKRLTGWRAKAQQAAAEKAGFAFHSYAQVKASGIVEMLAGIIVGATPPGEISRDALEARLWEHLHRQGLDRLSSLRGGATPQAIAFFRAHDLGFRIRRLRLLSRRLSRDWTDLEERVETSTREQAREAVFKALAPYLALETMAVLPPNFADLASRALADPGPALDAVAALRDLPGLDLRTDAMLAEALAEMPKPLRRWVLLSYLGFPFYDAATLPLHDGDGLNEFDPVKVDRISPEDCNAIRTGGAEATLRGREFFSFGAFFSRAYRENDYLWGRLHGVERMVDLIVSTVEEPLDGGTVAAFKRDAFLAVLDEEEPRLQTEPGLVASIRAEVLAG